MGDTAAGMYMSASYLTSIDNAQNHKFLAALKAKFGDQAKTANDLSEPQYEGSTCTRLRWKGRRHGCAEDRGGAEPGVLRRSAGW